MKTKTTLGILVVLSAVIGATVLMFPSLTGTAHADAASSSGAAAGGGAAGGGASTGGTSVVSGGGGGGLPSLFNSPTINNLHCQAGGHNCPQT
jgi:hypothetical protein